MRSTVRPLARPTCAGETKVSINRKEVAPSAKKRVGANLRREEDLSAGAIHVGLLDERRVAPAAPVHQAVGRVQGEAEGKEEIDVQS